MNDHIPQSYHTLPPGTVLPHNYIIERVLGEGGFGITYCCKLRHTDEHFALKEYFPNHIAYRRIEQESSTVVPFPEHQELFERERRRFLTEASILQELVGTHRRSKRYYRGKWHLLSCHGTNRWTHIKTIY